MIAIEQWPEEATRTPSKACFYTATCEVDGITYTARSRWGASLELARVLVAAGISDQPVRVHQTGHRGHLDYVSLHEMAKWTIKEDAAGLRRARFAAVEAARESMRRRFGTREKQAETDSGGVE